MNDNVTASPARPRIVVATDLTPLSRDAVERGALLARRLGAPLALLHVFDDSAWASLRALYDVERWLGADPAAAARDRLARMALALAERHRIQVDAETRSGPVDERITQFVAEAPSALLVVGEHGGDWLTDALLGGTALSVLEGATVPVLLVRRPAEADYVNLLVAVDGSAHDARLATAAADLCPEARKTLFHAYRVEFEGRMRLAGAADGDIERYREHERARATERLQALFLALDPAHQARCACLVAHGFPASAIFDIAERAGSDLLVIGRHRGGVVEERLLGSVTQNVLYHAASDVLLVP